MFIAEWLEWRKRVWQREELGRSATGEALQCHPQVVRKCTVSFLKVARRWYRTVGMLVGPHVNRGDVEKKLSIVDAVVAAVRAAAADDVKVGAVSLFVSGPQQRKLTLRANEVEPLRAYLNAAGIMCIAHGCYPDVGVWKGDPTAAAFVRREAELCARAGIAGVVVHLPSAPPERVLRFLPRLYAQGGARVYLETPSSKPAVAWYATGAELSALFRGARRVDRQLTMTGLCIDTAHIWACGADIASREGAEAWLAGLDLAEIPAANIMFHLNDNVYERGSGRDRHAPLFKGAIWSEYADRPEESGAAAFVRFATLHRIPAILERNPAATAHEDYAALYRMAPSVRVGAPEPEPKIEDPEAEA